MDKVLLINACTRPGSRTRQLTQAVLRKLDGTVEEVDLYGSNLTALGPEGIEKREIAAQTQDFSDPEFDLAKQFGVFVKECLAIVSENVAKGAVKGALEASITANTCCPMS